MNYERIRRRGLEKVSCEIKLICLGVNVRRYFNSINSNNKFRKNCWKNPTTLQREKFPCVKPNEKELSRN